MNDEEKIYRTKKMQFLLRRKVYFGAYIKSMGETRRKQPLPL